MPTIVAAAVTRSRSLVVSSGGGLGKKNRMRNIATSITTSKTAIAVSLIVPLVALGLPVLDTAAAIVRRATSGKRITQADRGHFHQQLIFRFGLNVRQAVLLLYAVCFVLGAVALAFSGEFTHVFRHAS